MKRLISAAIVIATLVAVTMLVMQTSSPRSPLPDDHPKLDALLASCDAGGSSLSVAYDLVSAHMPEYLTLDRHTALAAARGQVANVIDGRIATCEQALAIAQHDGRTATVSRVTGFVERLQTARTALLALEASLETGSDDTATKLAALRDVVHSAR